MKTGQLKLAVMVVTACALLVFAPTEVRAGLEWDFSFSGGPGYYGTVEGSGTITTSSTAVPLTGDIWGADVTTLMGYQITGITGTVNGSTITGLIDNANFPGQTLSYSYGYIWDNALIQGTPPGLDVSGILFSAGTGWYSLSANDTPDGGGYSYSANGDWHVMPVNLSISAVPVPEPTTLIAGALLLLPFGASTLRILRRNRAV